MKGMANRLVHKVQPFKVIYSFLSLPGVVPWKENLRSGSGEGKGSEELM